MPALDGKIYAIFHARQTSNKKLVDSIFSHPFFAATDSELLFLAHNGALKFSYPNKVSSEFALQELVKQGSLEKALPLLKEKTKTALNLLILQISRSNREATLSYFNYYLSTAKNGGEYYDLYTANLYGGTAVFSSTLKYNGIDGARKVEFDMLKSL